MKKVMGECVAKMACVLTAADSQTLKGETRRPHFHRWPRGEELAAASAGLR